MESARRSTPGETRSPSSRPQAIALSHSITGDSVSRRSRPTYGRALRGVLREFRFDTLAGRLGALQAPTLIVWGDADRWIPVRTGSRLAGEPPRAAFVVVPRTGHSPAEESPGEFNSLLVDFLKAGLSRIPENVAWYTPSPRSSRSSRSSSHSTPRTVPKSGS